MPQNVAVYPDEEAVFYREHDDNVYSVETFFLQYTLAEISFEICTCLVFAVLMDLAVGLHRTASLFFIVASTPSASSIAVKALVSLSIYFLTIQALRSMSHRLYSQ